MPWSELLSLVEPHYPKAGNGRQPVGLAIMLRTYFLQQWFNLSDPGMEEAFYKSPVLRRFAGVDLEWPFRILKRIFGFIKVRYRGLKKNHEWLCAAFALVNLYQHRNWLAPQGAQCLWRPGNGLQRPSRRADRCFFRAILDQNI